MNKPQVIIDLEEYENLRAYKDFKINSLDVIFVDKGRECEVDLEVHNPNFSTSIVPVGVLRFINQQTKITTLTTWNLKFIRNAKL